MARGRWYAKRQNDGLARIKTSAGHLKLAASNGCNPWGDRANDLRITFAPSPPGESGHLRLSEATPLLLGGVEIRPDLPGALPGGRGFWGQVMTTLLDGTRSVCEFSPCRAYRYYLERTWDDSRRSLAYLMLNPSTATETRNDPTVERCQRRAASLGYGKLIVVNLFALRSTDPGALYTHPNPVSEASNPTANDAAIIRAATESDVLACAWGSHGKFGERAAAVLSLFGPDIRATKMKCLGVTKDGLPRHPLYVAYSQDLVPFGGGS